MSLLRRTVLIALFSVSISLSAGAPLPEKNPFEKELKEIAKLKEDYEKAQKDKDKEKIDAKIADKEKIIEKKLKNMIKPIEDKIQKLENEIEKLKSQKKDTSAKEAELKKAQDELTKIELWAKGENILKPVDTQDGEKKLEDQPKTPEADATDKTEAEKSSNKGKEALKGLLQ